MKSDFVFKLREAVMFSCKSVNAPSMTQVYNMASLSSSQKIVVKINKKKKKE